MLGSICFLWFTCDEVDKNIENTSLKSKKRCIDVGDLKIWCP